MKHDTFVIDRTFSHPVAKVFAAWSNPAFKAQWWSFTGPDEDNWVVTVPHQLEFRVGGVERSAGGPKGGPVFTYQARYHDIVEDARIVLAYDMYKDDARISVSLGTFIFSATADGATRLVYTEQAAFFDGADGKEMREHGTRALFDNLAKRL